MNKPFAITLNPGSSLANLTGSWRTERPVYVDRLPPCNAQCPAGEDIQGWLFHAESGNYEKAWKHLTKDNPFPAIMGRVCYHSCEGACNRGQLDAACQQNPRWNKGTVNGVLQVLPGLKVRGDSNSEICTDWRMQ